MEIWLKKKWLGPFRSRYPPPLMMEGGVKIPKTKNKKQKTKNKKQKNKKTKKRESKLVVTPLHGNILEAHETKEPKARQGKVR